MSTREIVVQLAPWLTAAVAAMSALYVAAGLARRVRGGDGVENRTARAGEERLWTVLLLAGFIVIVLGLTNLSRPVSIGAARMNLRLFYAYGDAVKTGSITAFQLIVFNVLMFVPMGVLLPRLHRAFRSLPAVLLAGFGFSLFIECMQLINHTGIFELDDLFHNTLGAGFGYVLYAGFTETDKVKRRGYRLTVKAFSAALLLFSLFGAVYSEDVAREKGMNLTLSTEAEEDIAARPETEAVEAAVAAAVTPAQAEPAQSPAAGESVPSGRTETVRRARAQREPGPRPIAVPRRPSYTGG